MATRSCLAITAIMLLVSVVTTPVRGEERAPRQESSATEKREASATAAMGGAEASGASKVYTNEDLESLANGTPVDEMFKSTAVVPTAEPGDEAAWAGTAGEAAKRATGSDTSAGKAGAPPDPETRDSVAWLEQRQARAQQRDRLLDEAREKLDAATKRVADLEERVRKVKNPLLARPEIPADEREDWQRMSNPERLAQTEQALQAAQVELDTARRDLARLRAES